MGKIKNQTPQQKEIHNRAVKIRKMTDEELVTRFDVPATLTIRAPETPEERAELEQAFSDSQATIGVAECGVEEFLREIEAANLRGIGKITIKKIGDFAKEKGYI